MELNIHDVDNFLTLPPVQEFIASVSESFSTNVLKFITDTSQFYDHHGELYIIKLLYCYLEFCWRQLVGEKIIELSNFNEDQIAGLWYTILERYIIELNLSWSHLLEYNRLWWKCPSRTYNVFSSPYTRNEILTHNQYAHYYVKLNQHVITLKTTFYNRTYIDTEKYNTQHYFLQRPSIVFVCTQEQAKSLLEINNDFLGVVVTYYDKPSLSITKQVNEVARQNMIGDYDTIWCNFRFYPFIDKTIPMSSIYSNRMNKMSYVSNLIVESDDTELACVYVFYQYLNSDYEIEDPTQYMFQSVLDIVEST